MIIIETKDNHIETIMLAGSELKRLRMSINGTQILLERLDEQDAIIESVLLEKEEVNFLIKLKWD